MNLNDSPKKHLDSRLPLDMAYSTGGCLFVLLRGLREVVHRTLNYFKPLRDSLLRHFLSSETKEL
jgi:hypothetical protein